MIAYALTRPESVLVPTVIGVDQTRAETTLRGAGFEVAVKSVPSDNPPGTVTEQDPTAGSEADEGSTVTITVSSPDRHGCVCRRSPGNGPKQARSTLEDKGFDVQEDRRPSSTVRAGLAIDTEPPAGTELERGSRVILVVSSGVRLVQVPSVVGQQQDLAVSALRAEGLIPNVEQRDSDEPEGQVVAQDPVGGSTVKARTTVTVVVSTGAGSAFVPNVVGQSDDDARADLKDAGLKVRVVRRTTSDPNEDGQVLEQTPPAGTRLRRGEFVTIFVGKFSEPPTTTTPTTPAPGP